MHVRRDRRGRHVWHVCRHAFFRDRRGRHALRVCHHALFYDRRGFLLPTHLPPYI